MAIVAPVTFAPATRKALISVLALVLIGIGFAHMFDVGDTSIISNAGKATRATRRAFKPKSTKEKEGKE